MVGQHKTEWWVNMIQNLHQRQNEMMGATQGSLVVKPTGAMMVNGNFVSCPIRFSAKMWR
jgi:uncharacterized protein